MTSAYPPELVKAIKDALENEASGIVTDPDALQKIWSKIQANAAYGKVTRGTNEIAARIRNDLPMWIGVGKGKITNGEFTMIDSNGCTYRIQVRYMGR
jgi:hypothetical protein